MTAGRRIRTAIVRRTINLETYAGAIQSRLFSRRLHRQNRRSTRPVTGDAPVIVSLTSYGNRVDSVHLTIESLAAGELRPRRLILWLDDRERFERLTEGLSRLQERGLEIRLTRNLGPYTKFFPTLDELSPDDVLVTADDDLIYPRYWLSRLVAAHRAEPELVHCYRARDVVMSDDGNGFAPYDRWRLTTSSEAGFHRFATGVSGVIYPRPVIDALTAAGDSFTTTAPRADDIWLHFMTVSSGTRIRQLSDFPRHFPLVPGSQKVTLFADNVRAGGNDPQIEATYTAEVISRVKRDAAGPASARP